MTVLPLSAIKDNYIWVILDEKNGCFDCVDPGDAKPVIDFAHHHSLQLRSIFITHHHSDHIGGVPALQKAFPNVKIYGPSDERIPYVNQPVKGNQDIKSGELTFKILNTPGHTSSHISYFEPEHRMLFCGDTLFSAGCGRVFDGSIEELFDSLSTYKKLPDETLVYCAHEYTYNNLKFAHKIEPENPDIKSALEQVKDIQCSLPSSIRKEKKMNPFLRTDAADVIAYAERQGINRDNPLAIFALLRQEKDRF